MLVLASLLLGGITPHADTTVLSRPACTTCRVSTHLVRSIHQLDLPFASAHEQVVHHPSGTLLLLDNSSHLSPVLIDSSGQITPLTRNGAGPGEWRRPGFAWPVGADSFAMYDIVLRRMTTFSWTGQPGATASLPDASSGLALAPGQTLLSGSSGVRQALGRTYFVYGPEGFEQAWPEADIRVLPGLAFLKERILARNVGQIWSAQIRIHPVLERRSPRGRLLGTYRLDVPWYWSQEPRQPRAPANEGRPTAWARAIAARDSVVLVLYQTTRRNWREGMRTIKTPEGEAYVERYPEKVYECWLVVLHAHTGRLLVMQRMDRLWNGFTNDGDLLSVHGDGDDTFLDIYRLTILSN